MTPLRGTRHLIADDLDERWLEPALEQFLELIASWR